MYFRDDCSHLFLFAAPAFSFAKELDAKVKALTEECEEASAGGGTSFFLADFVKCRAAKELKSGKRGL